VPALEISQDYIMHALLIFVRVGAIIFFLPIFGDGPVPVQIRIGISICIAVIFLPLIPVTEMGNLALVPLTFVLIKESLVGLVIGFIARLVFDSIIMAASIVGYQMGFGMANLLMPDAAMQMSSFTALHRILVILLFFSLNLHHIFFDAIAKSYKVVPVGGVNFQQDAITSSMVELSANIFTISLQLAAPVLVGLLFTMAALGLIARTVPQMNVFTLSFPISFFVGLAIYAASLSFYPEWLIENFGQTRGHILDSLVKLR
jgi:flagellar biosynthesis protein FliR